jgi:DNA modification methylase
MITKKAAGEDAITPDPRNARKHGERNQSTIRASLKECGAGRSIVADAEGVIVAGNGVYEQAQALGLPVRVIETDGTELVVVKRTDLKTDDARRKLLALADNRTAELAEWDEDALAAIVAELGEVDLAGIGFDQKELAELCGNEPLPVTEDEVPEPPAVAITKRGDVWLLGEHRVMCGDSTSVDDVARLMRGKKAQLMFTDPPYGVGYTGGHFHSGDVNIKRERESLTGDSDSGMYARFLPVALPFLDGACYVWFASALALEVFSALKENAVAVRSVIVWNKTNAKYAAMNSQYKQRYEPLIYGVPKGASVEWCGATTEATVWDHDRDGTNTYHPTQKPVCLAAHALGNHNAKLILDPFLGSGSTLIAAEQLGRICYGMEISPAYCDVIVKRWENLTGKKATIE